MAFDLDGTLVDSATDLAAAASALTEELGGRALSTREVIGMVGEGAAVLVRRALLAAGLDAATPHATARFLELYDARLLDSTTLYPGIAEVLPVVSARAALSVVTNKPTRPARRLLDALGIAHHFGAVIGGDGEFPRKPDPSGLCSLALHDIEASLVLVGDSPVDADTAAAAGAWFVLAAYGFGVSAFQGRVSTDYVAEAPGDLPRLIGAALTRGRRAPLPR